MKAYCCLFNCLTIPLVQFEVNRNLQKNSCIMACQRFFSQRGLPERIHSDNALYFTSQRYRKMQRKIRLHGSLFRQDHHILVDHANASLGCANDCSSIFPDLGNFKKTVSQHLFHKSKLYSTADL